MKKTLITLFLAFIYVCTFAQHYQLIETFQLRASEGGYGIYADIDPTGSKDLFFDMDAPSYNPTQNVRMLLTSNGLNSFLGSLKSAKDQYAKWKELAKSQSATLFSKDLPTHFSDRTVYFTSDGLWYSETGVDLDTRFYIDNVGNCYLVLDTDYMTSKQVVQHGVSYSSSYDAVSGRWALGWGSSNTSITHYCAGGSLFFSSEQEIDDFIDKINKVHDWKENNVKLGKLFK